ncbi:reverse transcriptase-like protein [Candidatus Saccharibacteria bacterium]|nr:reverse transcriptase-like protein [Candidatus Saccharibacteria bacterium]
MKQRIRVVGIVSRGDDILLLKRAQGRIEAEPTWELPTAKITFGEQPEEAIVRAIDENLGASVENLELKDVITFVALSGTSRLYNLYVVYKITIPEDTKITLSERYSQYKFLKYGSENISKIKVEDASLSVLSIELGIGGSDRTQIFNRAIEASKTENVFRNVANGATIYTDGASRGNPGPAGIGYYIIDENGREIKRGGEFIGFATSRVAEYYGLKEACEQAIELGFKSVRFVSDSLMMINQLNGIYAIKNNDLLPIYNDIQELLKQFDAVAFVHVRREYNKDADEQANLAIDRHFDEGDTDVQEVKEPPMLDEIA